MRTFLQPRPLSWNGLLRLVACTWALVLSAAASAAGAPFELPAQYKAEMEQTDGFWKPALTMYYGGDGRVRVEATVMGSSGATIIRKDLKKSFHLSLDDKVWSLSEERPLEGKPDDADGIFMTQADATWLREGTQTICDIVCEQWLVTAPGGKRATYWLKTDHTPVRYQKGKTVMEVKTFTVGAQDAALFEPPANK